MTDPSNRRCAPGRQRSADSRPGSFKPGHQKLGGRKRGTPNLFSRDYKRAIIEAADRIGFDRNGKEGIVGYFMWVAHYHRKMYAVDVVGTLIWFEDEDTPFYDPAIYAIDVLGNRMSLEGQGVDGDTSAELRGIEDVNQSIRERIGLTGKNRTKKQTARAESQPSQGSTSQVYSVGALMHVAVADPKVFCKLHITAFRPPRKPRRPAPVRFQPHA
jgi:hypothetical protein